MVNIEMANGKNIKIELYPDVAPITVANFEKLVKEGFYDGLIFHRVISGFMIQGGDPSILIASNKKAAERLGWHPALGLDQIVSDAWAWHSSHPNGYEG